MQAGERNAFQIRSYVIRYFAVAMLACVGFGLTFAAFFVMREWEDQKIRSHFEFNSSNRVAALERAIESDLWLIKAVGGLYEVSANIERLQFRDFVKGFLFCHPGVQAMEWIPKVPDSRRDEYEKAARLERWPDFQITEKTAHGQMARASRREEYFPVYFVEPYEGNEIAPGFDLASNPARLEALELARDRGEPAATAPITLIQEKARQNGFLIFLPVYRRGLPADSVEVRRENIEGFVLGVFRIGDILEKALSNLHPEGIDILLNDISAHESESFLYFHPSRLRKEETGEPSAGSSEDFRFSKSITIANRSWLVVCTPIPEYISDRRGRQSWGLLFAGLFATCLLTAFLAGAVGRAARIERLVHQRTAELSDAKRAIEEAYVEVEKRIEERTAELNQSNRELKESEEKHKLLMENIPGILYRGFKDWCVEFPDNKIELLTGYRMDEFNSCTIKWSDLIHPEDLESAGKELIHALKANQPFMREYRIRTRNGDSRWIQDRGRAIRGNGQILSITGVFFDISDRKEAETALRERDDVLRSILSASPIGIGLARNGSLDWANPAMYRIVGHEEDSLFSKNSSILYLNGEEYRRANLELNAGIREKGVGESEARWITKDGKVICCHLHASPLDPSDPSRGIIYAVADITERKGLEEQIRHLQKMEAIGTLAGGIAHDFNNILGIIMGYAEMATFDAQRETPIWNKLQEVISASHRATELVRQILAFGRRNETQRTPALIAPLTKEALKLLRSSLPSTIEIHQNIGESSGSVLADPVQIHQILMNLCTNAAHAMRGQAGILDISLVDVELGPEHQDLRQGRYMKLTVADTGHGMDQATKERIFEPYFTTKKLGEGTGLGLSVVHGIVKGMGGAITVESVPGKGTTFCVFLPGIESGTAGRIEVTEPLPTGNERILFVDDEGALIEIGKKMLEHLGYKVTARTSSVEALNAFRAKPGEFDLVITDMTMPNMTGVELAGEILRLQPGIPIILCTGFSELITAEKAKAMGIRELLMKPLVLADIAATVRRVLDSGMSWFKSAQLSG